MTTLTKEELEAIRERDSACPSYLRFHTHDDCRALLAHIDELTALVDSGQEERERITRERDAYRASVERSLEMINLRDGIINNLTRERDDEAHGTAEILWDALVWLDTFSPEDTAAVEQKFNLSINARAVHQKGEADG